MRGSSAAAVVLGLIQVQAVLIQVEESEDLVLQKNSSAVPELLQKDSTKNSTAGSHTVPACCVQAKNDDTNRAVYANGYSVNVISGNWWWMPGGCTYISNMVSGLSTYSGKNVYHYNRNMNDLTMADASVTDHNWEQVPGCPSSETEAAVAAGGWTAGKKLLDYSSCGEFGGAWGDWQVPAAGAASTGAACITACESKSECKVVEVRHYVRTPETNSCFFHGFRRRNAATCTPANVVTTDLSETDYQVATSGIWVKGG